jgi:type I restriction enzyme S subunit
MEEWKEYKLKDVTSVLGDGIHGTPKYDENGAVFFINGNNLENGKIIIKENTRRVSVEESIKYRKPLTDRTILVSINGTLGNVARYNGEPCILGKSACYFNVKEEFDLIFIYYVVANGEFRKDIERLATGTTIKNVSLETMRNYTFYAPSLKTQKQIASILKSLDDKIEVNRKINENLEQQAQALFKSWFVDFEPFKNGEFVESELGMIPKGWRVKEAQDAFEINIGKTPPRKESEWFTESNEDNVWVSIADMGSCGVFISNSSEYLTDEAIKRFNVQMVEKDSVLLSFKLTVGRVAIADTRLTTNEAIARFVLPDKCYRELLYLYLKQYKYENLGSTSSIATAVNSKTIKGMKLIVPPTEIIKSFSNNTRPLFEQIRCLQQESRRLAELRDTLLPKLMSGELKVNEIEK